MDKYQRPQTLQKESSFDEMLAVSMGFIPQYSSISKFGVNFNVLTSSDPEDIWEFGGLYPFDTFGSAPILYISCSGAGDVGLTIIVYGLDIDGNEVVQEVTTNGQSNVLLGTPLWRVNRMRNSSPEGSIISGILYCHTDALPTLGVPADANVRAIIDDGKNSTLMAIYTIPKGKIGFFKRGEVGVQLDGNAQALAEYAHCHIETRAFGENFTVEKAVTLIVGGNAAYCDNRVFPDPLPSLTDIKVVAEIVSADMGVWATFDILLVDADRFSDKQLESFGQPIL